MTSFKTVFQKWYYSDENLLIAFTTSEKEPPYIHRIFVYVSDVGEAQSWLKNTTFEQDLIKQEENLIEINLNEEKIVLTIKSITALSTELEEMMKLDFVLDKNSLLLGYITKKSVPDFSKYVKEPKQNLPIPTHLKKILVIDKNGQSEEKVTGSIRCECGGEEFLVKTDIDKSIDSPKACGNIITAKCKTCGKEYLIFDAGKHGWDGFVCHQKLDEVDLENWKCPKCNADTFKMSVIITSQGMQDFIKEAGLEDENTAFEESDWVNAFDWICISLRCCHCDYLDKNWVDYETM